MPDSLDPRESTVAEQPAALDERNAKMLSMLAGMGAGGELISILLDMGGHKLSLDDQRFLRGPIIYGQSPWSADIPKWMFDQVREERADIATGQLKMPVGPTEIAVVMYGRSMEAPMPYHMNELYLWATANACARHYGKPVSYYWKQLDMRPIPDSEVVNSHGSLGQEYSALAAEIRRKVISTQAARERGEKRQVREKRKEEKAYRDSDATQERIAPIPPEKALTRVVVKPVKIVMVLGEDRQTLSSYEEANDVIRNVARELEWGFVPIDIVVTFADGETYTDCYEVVPDDLKRSDMLQQHMQDHLSFLSGTYRPSWTYDPKDEPLYHDLMAQYKKDGIQQKAREFLVKYDLGQKGN